METVEIVEGGKTYRVEMLSDGTKRWYLHGKRHREGGPAVLYSDGTNEWYLWGVEYTYEEWRHQVLTMSLSGV